MSPVLAVPWRVLVAGVLVVASAGIVSIVAAPPAGACSCGTSTDERAIEDADATFTGTLVEVISPTGDAVSSAEAERFVFEVQDVFKGEVTATQTVVTPWDGSSCGLDIAGPGPYLVFAYDDSQLTSGARAGELYSHLCSGTRALADGELSVDVTSTPPIEAGNAPAMPDGRMEPGAAANEAWVLAAASAGVVAVIGVWFWWRRMREPGQHTA